MEWGPQWSPAMGTGLSCFQIPHFWTIPQGTIIILRFHLMCQVLVQHFTCITLFHSFSKNALSTSHVQDTGLDLSTEQTQTSCFHGSDTLVPQPITITWGVFTGGECVGERESRYG